MTDSKGGLLELDVACLWRYNYDIVLVYISDLQLQFAVHIEKEKK